MRVYVRARAFCFEDGVRGLTASICSRAASLITFIASLYYLNNSKKSKREILVYFHFVSVKVYPLSALPVPPHSHADVEMSNTECTPHNMQRLNRKWQHGGK